MWYGIFHMTTLLLYVERSLALVICSSTKVSPLPMLHTKVVTSLCGTEVSLTYDQLRNFMSPLGLVTASLPRAIGQAQVSRNNPTLWHSTTVNFRKWTWGWISHQPRIKGLPYPWLDWAPVQVPLYVTTTQNQELHSKGSMYTHVLPHGQYGAGMGDYLTGLGYSYSDQSSLVH